MIDVFVRGENLLIALLVQKAGEIIQMARKRVAAQAFALDQRRLQRLINRQKRVLVRRQFQKFTRKDFNMLAFALGLAAVFADDAAFFVIVFFAHVRFRFSAGCL